MLREITEFLKPNNMAVFLRRLNGWLTGLWIVPGIPISIYFDKSIPYLVFLSVYAIITGHLSTWQSARVEVKQDIQADSVETGTLKADKIEEY
jgi:hypothetical protein